DWFSTHSACSAAGFGYFKSVRHVTDPASIAPREQIDIVELGSRCGKATSKPLNNRARKPHVPWNGGRYELRNSRHHRDWENGNGNHETTSGCWAAMRRGFARCGSSSRLRW